jgi:uncharacterized protein (TIGR02466 family)
MQIFPTEIERFGVNPDQNEELFQNIIDYIRAEEKESSSTRKYSIRGDKSYHSKDLLCMLDDDWSKQLHGLIWLATSNYFQKFHNKVIPSVESCRTYCWGMLMRTGGSSAVHCHPHTNISGVLWLRVPPDLESPEGDFVFLDPRQRALLDKNALFPEKYLISPNIGSGIVFPSWLDHYVEPHFCEGDRISIAWNMEFM